MGFLFAQTPWLRNEVKQFVNPSLIAIVWVN